MVSKHDILDCHQAPPLEHAKCSDRVGPWRNAQHSMDAAQGTCCSCVISVGAAWRVEAGSRVRRAQEAAQTASGAMLDGHLR